MLCKLGARSGREAQPRMVPGQVLRPVPRMAPGQVLKPVPGMKLEEDRRIERRHDFHRVTVFKTVRHHCLLSSLKFWRMVSESNTYNLLGVDFALAVRYVAIPSTIRDLSGEQ